MHRARKSTSSSWALGPRESLSPYLAWKTTGVVQSRSRKWGRIAWLVAVPLWALVTGATARIQPIVFTNLLARPWSLRFVVLMLAGSYGVFHFLKREQERDLAHSLSAENAAARMHALQVGVVWWTIGIILVVAYFVHLFRSIRGKTDADAGLWPLTCEGCRGLQPLGVVIGAESINSGHFPSGARG